MTDWLGKPYYSLDAYLKKTFGEKVYKLSLDGGMTCPNRDGTCGDRGCIFCSAGGSGDFAGDRNKSIPEQIREQKSLLQQKRPVHKFIAYFQAYTNTYAPVEYLEKIFREAISDEEVVVLSIGTRPDCLGEEVLSLLEELNRIKPVWVELGLQTMHEKTAQYIRRGYPLSCFEQAVKWELMEKNPCTHATVPKHKSQKRDIWTADTLMYALSVCEDERLKLAINLSFSCSLRLGELLGLTWDCVDISHEAIEENRAYVFINKESQRIRKESLNALDSQQLSASGRKGLDPQAQLLLT